MDREEEVTMAPNDLLVLPAGIYFVRCYPGPDFEWSGFSEQSEPYHKGFVMVPSISVLAEWIRHNLVHGAHSGMSSQRFGTSASLSLGTVAR